MKNLVITISLSVLLFQSCNEVVEPETNDPRVVVEAYLHAGEPVRIEISKEILFKREESDSIFYVSDLDVSVSNGDDTFLLTDEGNGIYTHPHEIDPSKFYSLDFIFDGQSIASGTSIPSKPTGFEAADTDIEVQPFTGGGPPSGGTGSTSESLELTWDNFDFSYYIVVVTNLETNPVAINTSGFSRPSFRSEPLVSDNYEVRSIDFQYYGNHSVILYKVNPEYAALYEDPGDNTLTIKTPFSNIQNGLGIFTAINSDTLYVNVHD